MESIFEGESWCGAHSGGNKKKKTSTLLNEQGSVPDTKELYPDNTIMYKAVTKATKFIEQHK
jgi:hypothetical protein